MKKILVPSFLGNLVISWSDLGLEKIEVTTEGETPPTPEVDIPDWVQAFLMDLGQYLKFGNAIPKLPRINASRWTDFQKQIYHTLFSTKLGETLTYGELAKRCSRPLAARSVGAAMSHNALPVLIPCHRVLPASGKIGNYTGGEGPLSKMKLLNFEKRFCSAKNR